MSVTVQLGDDIDVSRGDMICRTANVPMVDQDLDAMVAWLNHLAELQVGRTYLLKHTTRTVRCKVQKVQYRLDINSLHRDQGVDSLAVNEIGRVSLRTSEPIFFDDYKNNRATGSFILIDEATNLTVAGGMLRRIAK